ncbi:MAG TPA: HEAT repeat domain-containing protein [Candidatus Acidoferrum sp.]|nr:HEAT repeat domain-containing protein [Candidatus Acidoferrum sp.]
MSRWRRVPQKRAGVRLRTLGLLVPMGVVIMIPGQTAASPATQTKQTVSNPSANPAEPPKEKAWNILHEGLKDSNPDIRSKAVRALGLLTGNAEAEKAAVLALKDEKANVRQAAAHALGAMRAATQGAISKKRWETPCQAWSWRQRIRCCCCTTMWAMTRTTRC